MPLKQCQIDGKSGWKWGDVGKCYTGPDAKKKAIAQGLAISKDIPEEGLKLAEIKYDDYPKEARENAKRALQWIEKYGRSVVSAGTLTGLKRANQIANGENLSLETVKRIRNFLNRHEKNSKINPLYEGTPWKDKGYVAWLLWGGEAMIGWVNKKINESEK